ncbi:LPS-assembly lipoprotein [Oryzisolibacter propanilivorax]|uniref:LPS-assembly lipoprotein LptE n=1 Tax=Oryzisolibacter propanilivorax TaxID=1527607 RepID=A0A1G9Q4H9_9BURK|nr:LPS assembly lipoprotein LptE [Oryzisolibacter propanilivorax]SDM05942.1 LPS-assembly lipoprotein [Oryzisolibacter propanilivorax]
MRKRTLLLAAATTLPLAACGFRLRGVPKFAFSSLHVQAPETSGLARELRRTLQGAGGAVAVLTEPAQLPQAQAVLEILAEQPERVVVGQSAAGQVRELQLRLRLRFRLRGQDGQEWIAPTELVQQRDVSYNETVALSKEGEEALLFRNMQTDLVQQLMRRLAAAKGPM